MLTLDNHTFFENLAELVKEGKTVRIRVQGESMRPFLRGGRDEVEVASRQERLRPGDIVLFRYRGQYILHRLVKEVNGKFIFQGDGITGQRETASGEGIVAVCSCLIRGGKKKNYRSRWRLGIWRCWINLPGRVRDIIVYLDKLFR